MRKNLIVTIMMGDDPSFYFAKKSFKDYANKVNADFLCIDKVHKKLYPFYKSNNLLDALFEKLNLGIFLKKYERILYLDGDILITPHAQNIFNVYKDPNKLYMFNEGLLSNRSKELNIISSRLKKPIKDRNYFNAGVILFSRNINFLQKIRIQDLEYFFKKSNWFDQTYINFKYRLNNLKIGSLDYEFNRIGGYRDNNKRFSANFIHYAGNVYCNKKMRPIYMLKDYCYLYNYSLTSKEKINFAAQYLKIRTLRIFYKFKIF